LDVLAELGDDAIKQVNQHGIDLIPFFNYYEDDGLKLLKNNDEAAEFVLKYWNDAPDKVDLAVDFGKPAMQLMDSVDSTGARKLLDNLDAADIDSVIKLESSTIEILSKMEPDKLAHLSNNYEKIVQLGPNADHLLKSVDTESFVGFVEKLDDVSLANVSNLSEGAVVALSKWEGKDLVNYGSELITRAEKDAVIFEKLTKLKELKENTGKIDFDSTEVNKLIDEIAENSIQDGSGRFALGKWAGRDGGYIGLGRNNGYIFYESPGDFWNAVDTAVGDQKDDLFWAINQNVLEKQIKNDMIFEYTLDGINSNNIEAEKKAIAAVWNNADDDILIDLLPDSTLPSRMKELREIKAAGYSVEFIEKSNSFVFTIVK
jgi:hypothetical protein